MQLFLLRAALALSLISSAPDTRWQTGHAVRYNPGVMRRVAQVRKIPPQRCMVAWTYARSRDMGRVWLEVVGVRTGVSRRCLVVDLPQAKHRPALVRRGVVVELDYTSSFAICGRTWTGNARECRVKVRKL
jgi:hypothetical protein